MNEKPSWIGFFRFRGNEAQLAATRGTVTSSAAITGSYLAMNAAATLLAGLGLLQKKIKEVENWQKSQSRLGRRISYHD